MTHLDSESIPNIAHDLKVTLFDTGVFDDVVAQLCVFWVLVDGLGKGRVVNVLFLEFLESWTRCSKVNEL